MLEYFRTVLLGVTVALSLALSLSACQVDPGAPGETAVSPSHTESTMRGPFKPPKQEDPAEAAKAENVAAAEQRYLEFQEITSAHSKKGRNPFDDLIDGGFLGTSELRNQQQSFWEQVTDLKLKQTGEPRIEVLEVTKYEGDPLEKDVIGHRVHMKVCIDNSHYDLVRPDGSSALQKGVPERVLMNVVMQGQQRGLWSVNETGSTEREC